MTDKQKSVGYVDTEQNKVIYPFANKEFKLTPEEEVRLLMVRRLVMEYGYLPDQMEIEVSIKTGQTETKKRADIVVFKDTRNKEPEANAYLIVETKKKDRKDGVDQLQTYLNNTTGEFGIWFNGQDIVYLHRLREPHEFEELPDIPKQGETIDDIGAWDKTKLEPAIELKRVFEVCHNHIYANEGFLKEKVFNEMLKLIFIKMADEKTLTTKCNFRITAKEKRDIEEGNSETIKAFTGRIIELFQKVKRDYADVYDENEKINLRPTTLAFVVGLLQKYSLISTDTDVKGTAFQTFVYAHQRGDRGEFFTPHPIVELMVNFLDPSPAELVFDPACGSGGFLVRAMKYIWEKIESQATHLTPEQQLRAKLDYAIDYIKGIDFNPDLAKVSKMQMILFDDGHTGIFSANSLDLWKNIKQDLPAGTIRGEPAMCEVLLTNPPFGSKGLVTNKNIITQFELGYKWEPLNAQRKKAKKGQPIYDYRMMAKPQDGQPPEILFVERSLQFLKPNGRMGIVLPDGLLSNSSLAYVRRWIKNHARILAVVSLPPETFIPHGTGVKASIMFLQKLPEEELRALNKQGYNIFFASIKKIGYKGDKVGTPLYKRGEMGELILDEDAQPIIDTDVPSVIEAFLKFRVDENLKFHEHGEDLLDAIQRGERQLDFF